MDNDKRPPGEPIIFPCSGASDTGAIADGAARKLARRGVAKMYCLAGVGAKVEQIVTNTSVAQRLVAVDGCENDCARKVLEAAGFTPAVHLRLSEIGMEKGSTPVTGERVRQVMDEIRRRLEEDS